MSNSTVYLISGANRGIGFGLVALLVAKPETVVFAGTRNPSTSDDLNKLAETHKNLFIVKLTSGDEEDNSAAIKLIKEKAGKLDVIIANAGGLTHVGPVVSTPVKAFQEHFEINTLGPIVLFQTAATLLLESAKPKFVLISTAGASLATPVPFPVAAYGGAKAYANFVLIKMNAENENLVTLAVHPGMVQSESGNAGAIALGLEKAPHTIKESTESILNLIEKSKKEDGVRFVDAITGDAIAW